MFKIKSLILLLISINLINCSYKINNTNKFSIGYIGGSYEGILFRNILEANLRGFNIFNENANLIISGNANHFSSEFITKVDNTSKRERIYSDISINIFNKELDCTVYNFSAGQNQFYIYASGAYFLSNKKAKEDIIYKNTESLVKEFLNSIPKNFNICEE